MARNLATQQNVIVQNSQYPYGRIKDNPGDNTGTPVNEAVYGDIHQFFARLFAVSGLVYNNLPDNAYTGFQFYSAFTLYVQRNGLGNFLHDAGAPPGGTVNGRSYFIDTDTGNIYYAANSAYSQIMAGWVPLAWIEVGSGGGAPAFQNSWDNLTVATPARFRKTSSGLVTLDGIIDTGASGSVAFTLPVGYRPTKQVTITVTGSVVGVVGSFLTIETNGDVKPFVTGGGTVVLMTLNGHFYNS